MADNKKSSLNIKGENVKVWRRDIEGKGGTFHRYSVTSSTRNEDGSWSNAYIQVMFSKNCGAPKKIQNGAVCDFEGFMSAKSYTNRDGKTIAEPVIMIMKVDFQGNVGEDLGDVDNFEQAEMDIPFN
jgi:hypothetical protein